MSILSRFKDIMSANINALLDKCEDPAKMIDQYLRQLKEDLAEVKQETAAVMAEEKRTKRRLLSGIASATTNHHRNPSRSSCRCRNFNALFSSKARRMVRQTRSANAGSNKRRISRPRLSGYGIPKSRQLSSLALQR